MSYSCTDNVANIMKKHNQKVLNPTKQHSDVRPCNCRNPTTCPVENKCRTKSVIYKATVEEGDKRAEYIGSTELEFKTRFNLHTYSFRDPSAKSATTLSSYVWQRNLNPKPPITWQIMKKCHEYKPGMTTCDICLSEKFFIVKNLRNTKNLNKRTDIGNKCVQHVKKHKLDHI